VGFLIEIIVVAALILGGFALYMGLMGGKDSAAERALNDPTGTTTAVGLQHQLQAGPDGREPYGRPAEGVGTPEANGTAPGGTTNAAPAPPPPPNVRQPASIPGRAVYKARGEQCRANLQQLRMLVQSDTDDHGGVFPKSLTDVPDSLQVRICPNGGQEYLYDPQTGKVSCNTPGHEGF